MQVVVPCASSVPLASKSLPSAVPERRPTYSERAFGADRTGLVGHRAHEVHLDLQRRVAGARRQVRLHRAAHAAVEQRRGHAAMHGADRVVVPEFGRHLEAGITRRHLGETKAQRRGDRRRRQTAIGDASAETPGRSST